MFIYCFVGKQFKQTLKKMITALMRVKKVEEEEGCLMERTEIVATVRKYSWETGHDQQTF